MLPTETDTVPPIGTFPTVTRIELEYLSSQRVRLVAWCGDQRDMQLTADPRDPRDLAELLAVAEVVFTAQAGGDHEQVLTRLRERTDA